MLVETQVSAVPAWGFVLAPQQGPRYCEAKELSQHLFLPDVSLAGLGLLGGSWISWDFKSVDALYGFKICYMGLTSGTKTELL